MKVMTLSERARAFAVEKHGDQRYGRPPHDQHPYVKHLDDVVGVLDVYGAGEQLRAAGYLHDVIEDCAVKKEDLAPLFGARVAHLVDAVTNGEGKNRKERQERAYRLIPTVPGALKLKLADRIANVTAARADNPGLFAMYKKEHEEFRNRLYVRSSSVADMWRALDNAVYAIKEEL